MAVFDNKKLFDEDKVNKSLESTVWGTPPEIFNPINKEFGFTLDVCAIAENAKAVRFFTPIDNGLKQPWDNEVCWCNPPYGREVGRWVEKAFRESGSQGGPTIVMLLPARTDTAWFHDYILGKAEIRFLRGRLYFNDTPNGRAPFPSMVVVFGTKL